MQVLLDIKENKVDFVLELLSNLPYMKTLSVSSQQPPLLKELQEAVEEMKLIKAGKKEARNAQDFLNEL